MVGLSPECLPCGSHPCGIAVVPCRVGLEASHRERVVPDFKCHLLVAPCEVEPSGGKRRRLGQRQQFVHHLEAAHDGEQMIGGAQGGVAVIRQPSGSGVITLGQVARENAIGQSGDGAHAFQNLVAIPQVARPFPFGHPVAGIGEPVGSHPEACRRTAREFLAWFGQPHRVEMVEQGVGIHLSGHQVARALIGGEVIIEPAESRLTDACLLGPTAPVAHVMAAAQGGERSDVIGVDLAVVACHGLCHPPDVGLARAQEVVPEPHGRGQFGIVPGIASHIVAPGMTVDVVSMHYVAIVPEAIPFLLVDGILVEIDVLVEAALHVIVALGQRPDAESAFLVEILRCGKQPRIGGQPACVGSHLSLAAIGCLREEPHHTGAGDAIGRAQALLHILVAGAQAMGNGVVMAEVHRLRLRTPQPQGQFGLIGARLAHFYGRGIRLPEVLQRHAQTALGVAHESISGRADTRQRAQPWTHSSGPLADGERVVGEL